MLTPYQLVLVVLCTWRIARFLALDTLTAPMRSWLEDDWAWVKHGDRYELSWWRDKAATLIGCGYCNSFWLAGIVLMVSLFAFDVYSPNVGVFGIEWWAVAGAAAFLNRIDVGGEKQKQIAEAIDHVADSTGEVGGFDDNNQGETDG